MYIESSWKSWLWNRGMQFCGNWRRDGVKRLSICKQLFMSAHTHTHSHSYCYFVFVNGITLSMDKNLCLVSSLNLHTYGHSFYFVSSSTKWQHTESLLVHRSKKHSHKSINKYSKFHRRFWKIYIGGILYHIYTINNLKSWQAFFFLLGVSPSYD